MLLSFSSLPVSGQRGRVSTEGDGLGVALGTGWEWAVVSGGARPSGGLRTGGEPRTDHSQQGRAAADPLHVMSSVRRCRVLWGGSFIVGGELDDRR